VTTPPTPQLSGPQVDRAAGVLLATACGDALGAGYEFGPPVPAGTPILMNGAGAFGWAPGEWTDDTSMAIAIAEVTARGGAFVPQTLLTPSCRGGWSGSVTPRTSASRPALCWERFAGTRAQSRRPRKREPSTSDTAVPEGTDP